MDDKRKIDLISSEISGLWTTYMNDSMAVCMLKHFLSKLEDREIKHILEYALNISTGHLQIIRDKFNEDGISTPKGFGEDDVNADVPRLFTDPFYLFYLLNMAQFGMNNYTLTLNHVARQDIRDFFTNCVTESLQLFNLVTDALLQQGLYIKCPRIEFRKEVEFIQDEDFFSAGWLGKKRSLTAGEITVIFASLRQNIIGEALITGFAQVAKTKKLSDYLFKGRDLAWKKVEALNTFFIDEKLPMPSTSDSFVTDSTISPFSDKLILYQIGMLFGASIGQDGTGLANAMRHDLQAYYVRSMAETGKYADDGLDIMVENKWFEQPPIAVEHERLIKM